MTRAVLLGLLLSGCAGQHQADETMFDLQIHVVPHESGGCEVWVSGVDSKDRGVKNIEIKEGVIPK